MSKLQPKLTVAAAMIFAACGVEMSDPIVTPPPPPPESPGALTLRTLAVSPGCYLPFVQLGECNQTCQASRNYNAEREQLLADLLTPYIGMVAAINHDPYAIDWTTHHRSSALKSTYRLYTRADHRPVRSGVFEIVVSERNDDTQLEAQETIFGAYTPHGTLLDLGDTILRWTDSATALGQFHRGCDPETGVSFDARYDDLGQYGLHCWDRGGNLVDCDTVATWPR